jgi:hypothetical protein
MRAQFRRASGPWPSMLGLAVVALLLNPGAVPAQGTASWHYFERPASEAPRAVGRAGKRTKDETIRSLQGVGSFRNPAIARRPNIGFEP